MTNDTIEQHPVNRVCREVTAACTRALKRVQHKIERQRLDLSEARDHATYTRHGEMLLASMALLKRGLTTSNWLTHIPQRLSLSG